MICQWDRDWDDVDGQWVCQDCGKVASSTNMFTEPCLECGVEVEASEDLCQKCKEN